MWPAGAATKQPPAATRRPPGGHQAATRWPPAENLGEEASGPSGHRQPPGCHQPNTRVRRPTPEEKKRKNH
eukprot:9182275-Alexandrium_andersonii.AAC.1